VRLKVANVNRLCVYRSPKHIYAQVISAENGNVLVSASTVEKGLRHIVNYGGNIAAAEIVGKTIAERALQAGIGTIAFDRSGYKYHGRVKALADAVRNCGIQF
jgi:large subunit ribosomal protein L18